MLTNTGEMLSAAEDAGTWSPGWRWPEPLPGKLQVVITISVNSSSVRGLALSPEPCWVRMPTAEPFVWQRRVSLPEHQFNWAEKWNCHKIRAVEVGLTRQSLSAEISDWVRTGPRSSSRQRRPSHCWQGLARQTRTHIAALGGSC